MKTARLFTKIFSLIANLAIFYGVAYVADSIVLAFTNPPVGYGEWLVFFVSLFFNGIALPILGYSGKKEARRLYTLVKETHDAVIAERRELEEIRKVLGRRFIDKP